MRSADLTWLGVQATRGILPDRWIREAIRDGVVGAASAIEAAQVQPVSLDLRLGPVCHRVQCSFQPGRGSTVGAKLEQFGLYTASLEGPDGAVLERNHVYLIPLEEHLALPAGISARANPKSSTGRLDVFTRVVTEGGESFDDVAEGYAGPLFLEVAPRSFAIRARRGDSLAQLRFQVGDARLDDAETRHLLETDAPVVGPGSDPIPAGQLRVFGGVFLSVDLMGRGGRGATVGYRARKNTSLIDLRERGLPISKFWEWIYARPSEPVILQPDEFYVFASRERVRVSPRVCAEMVPFDAGSGEMRTHYAGFFDSGFGYPPSEPARVVLEVRNRDVPFLIEHGQPLFRVQFLANYAEPDALYGAGLGSHYQGQGLRLAKQFGAGREVEDGAERQARLSFGAGEP